MGYTALAIGSGSFFNQKTHGILDSSVDEHLKLRQVSLFANQYIKLVSSVELFSYSLIYFGYAVVDIQIFQKVRRVGLLGRRVGIFVNLTMD